MLNEPNNKCWPKGRQWVTLKTPLKIDISCNIYHYISSCYINAINLKGIFMNINQCNVIIIVIVIIIIIIMYYKVTVSSTVRPLHWSLWPWRINSLSQRDVFLFKSSTCNKNNFYNCCKSFRMLQLTCVALTVLAHCIECSILSAYFIMVLTFYEYGGNFILLHTSGCVWPSSVVQIIF
jgi:hypothetical protein